MSSLTVLLPYLAIYRIFAKVTTSALYCSVQSLVLATITFQSYDVPLWVFEVGWDTLHCIMHLYVAECLNDDMFLAFWEGLSVGQCAIFSLTGSSIPTTLQYYHFRSYILHSTKFFINIHACEEGQFTNNSCV